MNIGVNDGHTIKGYGTGAVGIINEGVQTRIVGTEVRRLINAAGHKAINCTVDYANSVSQSLSKIMDQANRQDLDWFIAIHFNAGGGVGVENYTYGGNQYPDAVEVCSNIAKLGFRNRGVKDGKGLYVIRKTKAKSMLIEVCFVDTADANHYLQIGYKAIAKAIVESLIGAIKATPAVAPVKVVTTGEMYRVRKTWADASSQIQAFSILANAKSYVNNHPGYSLFNSAGQNVYSVAAATLTSGTVTASVLNVRKTAVSNSAIIGKLNKGSKVKIAKKVGNMYNIYFGDNGGYVSADYIK
ncbi:N-acetylmuramoyl-L-alanine amidase [Clostridium lacusfryxellense]|uniref:N-acetylmuramoyl-L-alanine amidase n=1 Tax=Clostridium lacusfryxellense TaxID=205328 RepID=UPI001C0E2B3D|nr:N-acetylmuramoyl-L-alanine amidase [Clostridium lacusfryxellense]MBU3112015.1 N-acetylmuramoyl-L-alanine amidase [Clostridium lacusfryxellense]